MWFNSLCLFCRNIGVVVLAEVNQLIRSARTSSRSVSASPTSRRRARSGRSRGSVRGGKHGYTPSAGIDELRAAAASMARARGISISPDEVVVGAGAKLLSRTPSPR